MWVLLSLTGNKNRKLIQPQYKPKKPQDFGFIRVKGQQLSTCSKLETLLSVQPIIGTKKEM